MVNRDELGSFAFTILVSCAFFLTIILVLPLQNWGKEGKLADNSTVDVKGSNVFQASENPRVEIVVILIGDVMLGRSVMAESLARQDPIYPFRNVADTLRQADLVFINLENPIIDNCPTTASGFKFCASPEMVKGLVYSGVDVASLANNHTDNFGLDGLNQTRKILEDNGILVTGLGSLAIKQFGNSKFGFLGFNKAQEVRPKLSNEEVELVKNSDSKVDVLVVAMHWGIEYQAAALPGVRILSYELIKQGADVIVGHHPHWVQDVDCFGEENKEGTISYKVVRNITSQEFVKGDVCPTNTKPVFYSLGNFIFDQMWSEETKKGAAVELSFSKGVDTEWKVLDTYIKNLGQPEFLGNKFF